MKLIRISYLVVTLLILALYLMPAVGSAATVERYQFRVLLDGDPVGIHSLDILHTDDMTQVDIQASLDVRLLFISVYRYQHNNTEIWRSDCLYSIESTTNDNGESYQLKGRGNDENLQLETASGSQLLPGCIRSFAYWNPELLKAERLLNAQTGEYQPVSVKQLGSESIKIDTRELLAKRLQVVTGEDVIDLWYANDDRWVALQSTTRSGRTLRYEIMEALEDV